MACALHAGGSALCWGRNGDAELGDGTQTDAPFPVAVAGLHDALSISAGSDHSCAVRANHTVLCWGFNWQGIVGSNPQLLVYATTPVAVAGLSDVTAVDADGYFSCALRSTGNVMCWGDNRYGELGRGAFSNYEYAPAAVLRRHRRRRRRHQPLPRLRAARRRRRHVLGRQRPRARTMPACPRRPRRYPSTASATPRRSPRRRRDLRAAPHRAVVCWGIGDALTPVEVPGL